jgi:YD repeat-containing protein
VRGSALRLFLAAFALGAAAMGQTVQTPLSCGVVNNATIPNTGTALFGVTVQAGDAILLRLYAPNTNTGFQLTQVTIVDLNNNQVQPQPNEFFAGATYAGQYTMTLTGTYTVEVAGNMVGTFSIVYTNLNRPCNAATLACGTSVLGQITAPLQLATYQFQANAGDILEALIGEFAPYANGFLPTLFAYGPDGNILLLGDGVTPAAVNILPGQFTNMIFPVPTAGTVTLIVLDSSNQTGNYALSVSRLNAPCNNTANLTCGALAQGTIVSPLGLNSYAIAAAVGDVINLRVASVSTTGTFDPRAAVYDPTGNLVTAIESPTTGGHASSSGTFTAKLSGSYLVFVSDVATGLNTGSYVIGFSRLNRPCSSETALSCASLVNGSISGLLTGNLYSLAATANDNYLLRLLRTDQNTGSNFHPRVDIYDPLGNPVQFVSTANIGQVAFTTASTGTYTLVASDGYDNSQTGNYTLALVRLNRPCGAGALSCGALANAVFSQPLTTAVYTYNANAGQSFSVRMLDVNGTLRPALAVYDPSGNPVGQAIAGNFTGVDVPQPAGGAYTVVATDADPSPNPAGGPFDLDLLRTVNACGAAPPQGQTAQGVISGAEPFLSYTIPATSGDSLLVRSAAFNSGFNALMEIYDPTGTRLNASTYSLSRSVTTTGNYTVIVGPSAPRTGGAYSLSWQLLNNPAATGTLACGGSTTASIGADNEFRYYLAAANSGDLMRMIFTPLASTFSPAIELYNASGVRLAAAPSISQAASASGNYLVIVGPSSSVGQTGSFTVAYQRPNDPCTPTALTCGQTTLRLVTLPGQMDTYTFAGTASTAAAIQLTQRSGNYTPYAELYNPSATLLASGAGGELQPMLASTGTYTLLVRDLNANLGSYRVTLQNGTNTCQVTDTEPPVVTLLKPVGGEVIAGGTTYEIQWQSDDNVGVVSQAVDLSTDGGQTFPTSIAAGLSGTQQSYTWIVPATIAPSRTAVVRVTATDAAGNATAAVSGPLSVIGSGFTANSTGSYTYDGLNRLTQATLGDGRTVTYTWDLAGNLISITVTGQ